MEIMRNDDVTVSGQSWRIRHSGREYWVSLRRTGHGPVWTASVFVEPKSDQKPYWRPLKNWQKLACEVRAFECNT